MKKSRKVSISISLPLERLVYLTQRTHDTDMSTSEYVDMLLVDDQLCQKRLEDIIDSVKDSTPEEIAASTDEAGKFKF